MLFLDKQDRIHMKVRLFRNKADLPPNSFAQGVCTKAHPFSSCLAFDDETGSVKRNSLDIVFDCDFEYGFLAAVPLLESIDFVLTIEIGGYVVSQVVINRVAIVFEIRPSIRAIAAARPATCPMPINTGSILMEP